MSLSYNSTRSRGRWGPQEAAAKKNRELNRVAAENRKSEEVRRMLMSALEGKIRPPKQPGSVEPGLKESRTGETSAAEVLSPAMLQLLDRKRGRPAGPSDGQPPVELRGPFPQHGEFWTCPATGLLIPKTFEANLKWRSQMLRMAETDTSAQDRLKEACGVSPWFWVNGFCWTYLQKKVGADGQERPTIGEESHTPFITWLVQDEFIGELKDCIERGDDALINKTRDMGASWLCALVIHWFWQFRASVSFLELSRKEDLVDSRGNMDSLFEKHRYLLRWQPDWLKPRRTFDRTMHLENRDNGSAIDGESTNSHAGQGGRRTAILLDEFARVPNGFDIDLATADTAACRIYNSTPAGSGTCFSQIYREKRARILELPWWRHPDKGRDAKQVIGESGRPKWTSPWYESEVLRRSKKNVAQNLDMDHAQSGETFFDAVELEKHRSQHVRDPLHFVKLTIPDGYTEGQLGSLVRRMDHRPAKVEISNRHELGFDWRLWTTLLDGRPPQDQSWIFGSDISTGSGDSNSVCSVLGAESGLIAAKFWSSRVSPEEFARIVSFAAFWFGGKLVPPLQIWENNGPGGIFGRKLFQLNYPRRYCQRREGTQHEEKTQRWGWNSSKTKKEQLLGTYRDELATGRVFNPCAESLIEAGDYVYDETGALVPGSRVAEKGGGRALHGDHVIADALTVLGRGELPKFARLDVAAPPYMSFAWRRHVARKREESDSAWQP